MPLAFAEELHVDGDRDRRGEAPQRVDARLGQRVAAGGGRGEDAEHPVLRGERQYDSAAGERRVGWWWGDGACRGERGIGGRRDDVTGDAGGERDPGT